MERSTGRWPRVQHHGAEDCQQAENLGLRTSAESTPSTGNVRACTEYLPGNQAIVPAARDACTGVINGYASHWDPLCPASPVNGCKYPPGTFGVPGVQVVWYYLTAGGCATEGTTITPEGYTFADAGTS